MTYFSDSRVFRDAFIPNCISSVNKDNGDDSARCTTLTLPCDAGSGVLREKRDFTPSFLSLEVNWAERN